MAFSALCVLLGMIGAVVPGMPTTVFILMAAWAAMRSSPRMHAWLYAHASFGPMLRNWDDGGRVSRRVKWMATLSMAASSALIVFVSTRPWLAGLALASMACVLAWLWLRPEPAPDPEA
ncbi:YbaN family protein [Comamonas antarctica]|uniref:YbaN family protein n=2 Tax=Comamonas antarctica TaxID=2743470 RepID=A0A6N1X6T5_9BURK|nr:YbaN family protein [Comamonas antarctica]